MINKIIINEMLLIAISLITVGFILSIYQLWLIFKNRRTKKWMTVKGTVLESNIDRKQNVSKETFEYTHKAEIKYKYCIEGKDYISERICFGDKVYKPYSFKAKRLIKKYPKYKEVNIYYNPLNKHEAVLEPGIKLGLVINLFMSIILLVIGMYLLNSQFLLI